MDKSQPGKCPYCGSNDTRHMRYKLNTRNATVGVSVVCMYCLMRGPIAADNVNATLKFDAISKGFVNGTGGG